MVKTKKRSLRQAKLDMDTRVQGLYDVIARGNAAAVRLPDTMQQLEATQSYLRNSCMYESARYEEGEKTPEDLEHEIDILTQDVYMADKARMELKEAARFYRAYHIVVNGPKIKEVKKQLNAVEYWLEQWQSRIWALDSDTDKDIDERIQEKDIMENEYARAREEACRLQLKLSELRNIKYM